MSRDDYSSIEHFLNDTSFVSWVESQKIEDLDHWEVWISKHPDKTSLVLDAELAVMGVKFQPPILEQIQIETALLRLHNSMGTKASSMRDSNRDGNKWYRGFGIAAVLLILILSTVGIKAYLKPYEFVHKTAYGEQMNLKLADGTEVALNANSTLSYFSNDIRNVWLEGEAFFEVEKKPSTGAKFIVHTADLEIEVLGTAFNVNSLNNETKVVLQEGKINLKLNDGSTQMMKPGELVTYSASASEQIIIKKEERIESEIYTSWKDGVLVFSEITLAEAMMKLESTYGVEVLFMNDELANRVISFAIPTKNLQICIEAIEKSMSIKIERKENVLIVK